MMSSEDIIRLAASSYSSKEMASEVLELDEDAFISMEYTDGAQKGKAAMNTILKLGKTLLHAAREGDTMSVIELMSKGAPFTTDWLGTSPLHLAAMNNHLETCETLLRAGIGKDAKTKVDRSPLHFAAYEGNTNIVQLLIKHGVEIDCRDMLHMTPLHWAVERQHEECAILLLQAGADPTALSRFHKTPISIAEEMEWSRMWDLLQSAHIQRSKECISNTAQAVEGITDGICLPSEDIILESEASEILEDESHVIEDQETEGHDHIENILPKVTQSSNEATVQMLREHGIVMIPNDNTNTVTSAVQSGRKIVLSDAGKLMLRDIGQVQKNIDIRKKDAQINKPTAKIYKMSSSQFFAITGQNKSNTFKKIPINITKSLENNANANKLKTLPVLKAININKTPTKITTDGKVISPYKGKIISLNSLTKLPANLSDEIMNVKSLANQGKTKVIQLKSTSNMGKTVKIVVKNSAFNKLDPKIIMAKPEVKNAEATPVINTSLNMPALIDIESQQTIEESTTVPKENCLETLKKHLEETREELERYKKRNQMLEEELNALKSRQYEIHTMQEEPELVTQIVESGFVESELHPQEVESEFDSLVNESVVHTTELAESEMESG